MCSKSYTGENGIHAFEKAGLGIAPFRVVGVCEKRGPLFMGSKGGCEMWCGSPGQPMGVCDYCGQGIAECWSIRSSDGKEFTVGCDCVLKAGDKGMRKVVNAHKAKKNADKRHAKNAEVFAFVKSTLEDCSAREALANLPHPKGFSDRLTGKPLTALDQADWLFRNCGAAGYARMAKWLKSVLVLA